METRFAVVENELVVNVAAASLEFGQSQGWIDCTDYPEVSVGWSYIAGEFISPPPYDHSEDNKKQAQELLQATDWTATVDINNPQYSNPYLGNQDAFLAYRSQVRQIAVAPPTTPAVFPDVPQEVWISV